MTGAAAILINGKTLHSYLGLGLGEESSEELVSKIRLISRVNSRWKKLDILIIDEISMMSPTLLEKIDSIARTIRKSNEPMGGIQTILSGDFFQLPPVSPRQSLSFCFESRRWSDIVPECIELTEIVRQSDPVFQRCLSFIRRGQCPQEVIDILESRRIPYVVDATGIEPTKLFTRNIDTETINMNRIARLEEPIKIFKAITSTSSGNPFFFKKSDAIISRLSALLDKNVSCNTTLSLCLHAQVILLKNVDFDRHLVNGSRGVIIGFDDDLPIVKFLNGAIETIDYQTWSIRDDDSGIQMTRKQLPLKLGYALTAHRSQGSSLDLVEVDIGKTIFEAGQAYVALSRVRSLDGLYIIDFEPSSVRAHPKVVAFYERLEVEV